MRHGDRVLRAANQAGRLDVGRDAGAAIRHRNEPAPAGASRRSVGRRDVTDRHARAGRPPDSGAPRGRPALRLPGASVGPALAARYGRRLRSADRAGAGHAGEHEAHDRGDVHEAGVGLHRRARAHPARADRSQDRQHPEHRLRQRRHPANHRLRAPTRARRGARRARNLDHQRGRHDDRRHRQLARSPLASARR